MLPCYHGTCRQGFPVIRKDLSWLVDSVSLGETDVLYGWLALMNFLNGRLYCKLR